MGFEIEDVGESVKKAVTSKTGKIVLIGGGVLLVGLLIFKGKNSGGSGSVSLAEYPKVAETSSGTNSGVADQMNALTDTFTESLTNMNTQFTDVLNAQQTSFQTQIDGITSQISSQSASFADSLNLMNDNFSDQIGTIHKSVGDVSAGLVDYANSQTVKLQAIQPEEYKYSPDPAPISYGGADYGTASKAVQQKMASDAQLIKSGNQTFIQNDLARTDQVIADRLAKKEDISAQLKHRNTLLQAVK